MIRIHQVKCASSVYSKIEAQILKKLKMPASDLLSWKIHRKSVDARGQKVFFSFTVDAEVRHENRYLKNRDVTLTPDEKFRFEPAGTMPLQNRPVVAGFGPAGLFAALLLAHKGYAPLIVERGSEIDKRTQDVERFWKEGLLNAESNVQFGMGGAGAFSDGKLTTRSKDLKSRHVYEELVRLGADPEILIEQHPHVGTDGFVRILKNAKADIESHGGTFLFDTRLDDIICKDGKLCAIRLSSGRILECEALILASGHSASDTVRALEKSGVHMEFKNFAAGVRIEHLQTFINEAMLKERAHDPALIPARYQLTHTAKTGKGVYTFCMCPGGLVIPASSTPETVVVNGMSYSTRDKVNANAALLVQIDPADTGEGVFAGLDWQEALEKKAYDVSHSYKAPAQLASDFVAGRKSEAFGSVQPSYCLGTVMADFNEILPERIAASLREGLLDFERKVPGFLNDAVLTGVETRSSASVRIVRDKETLMSNIDGLYPCGEGAGYAGGIVTSAIDGLRCAMALMERYARPEDLNEVYEQ